MTTRSINSIKELYNKFSNYSYACDAIAYWIFGDKSDDNIMVKALKGVYGRHTEICSATVSKFLLDYEYCWEDNMKEINEFVQNLKTNGGEPLKTYF